MKYLVFFILFIFVATFVFPQQNELTLEQLDEFFDSQITIIDYIGKEEVEPQPLSTKWRAYQSEKRLSERKYFLITGHELEAKQARAYHSASIPIIIFFSPIVGYSGILLTKSVYEWEIEHRDKEDIQENPIFVFPLLATIGISVALLVFGVKRLTNTRFPYSRAEVIMNEYNEKLLEEIKEK